jgi:hypothetical protein
VSRLYVTSFLIGALVHWFHHEELGTLFWPMNRAVHGSGTAYLAALSALAAVAMAPTIDVCLLARKWRTLLTRETLFSAVFIAGMTGVFAAAFWAVLHFFRPQIEFLLSWLGNHHNLVSMILGTLGVSSVMLFMVAPALARLRSDRRHFRYATRSTALTRGLVCADFLKFKSARYRVRYVEWLRDAQVHPQGGWPERRPNRRDDAASTLLAQLDEHWLGLEA